MDDVSVLNLFLEAGIVVKIVMLILFIASILSWIVIVERYNFFRKIKNSNDNFLKKFCISLINCLNIFIDIISFSL